MGNELKIFLPLFSKMVTSANRNMILLNSAIYVLEFKVSLLLLLLKPYTLSSDLHVISPWNISTLSGKQVVRIPKLIK